MFFFSIIIDFADHEKFEFMNNSNKVWDEKWSIIQIQTTCRLEYPNSSDNELNKIKYKI